MRLKALLLKNVGRYIIERGIDDAAMHGILKSNVVFVGCELRRALIAINCKFNLQANRVIGATSETHGCSFDLI